MAMTERNLEAVLDALGEKLRSLKTDLMVKDMEIDNLKEINANLEAEIIEVTKYVEKRETSAEN